MREAVLGRKGGCVGCVNKDNQQAHDYDVKEAEKLLKEAGYHKNSDGIFEKTGKPLTFNLVIQTAEFPSWKDKAEKVQRQLKKAGIKLKYFLFSNAECPEGVCFIHNI